MDALELLEELEDIVDKGVAVPFSGRCLLDKDELLEVLAEIKLKLPEDLKQAKWIKEERERIIADAKTEANNLIKTANDQIIAMVDENEITKKHKTVFIMQIGDVLRSGKKHDGRAPDYDDWKLNGDIMFWNKTLGIAFEISSMGIRVDKESLTQQLEKAGCQDRKSLPFHSMLLNDQLPLTMGGGVGQSRLCMLLMGNAHIGEVQSSIWDKATEDAAKEAGVVLL